MTEAEFAPRGIVEITRFLDVKAQELAQLQNQIQAADEQREEAELVWARHYDEVIEQLTEEDGKLPGEDVRVSIARRRGGWDAWVALRRAERLVRRLDKSAQITSNIISACQSEAKLLAQVEPYVPREENR